MAKNKTEKCCYPSRFSPQQWVHFASYLTELICERKAFQEYTKLPNQFWQLKKWQNYYRFQITVLNKLLKRYTEDAILYTFQDPICKNVYSFNSPLFLSTLEKNKNYTKPKLSVEKQEVIQILRPRFNQNNGFMSELT